MIVKDGVFLLPPEYFRLSSSCIGMLFTCHFTDVGTPDVIKHSKVMSVDTCGEYFLDGTFTAIDDGTEMK